MEAGVSLTSPGHIYESNFENLDLLPSKALPGSRLPKIGTCEANATTSLAFHTFLDFVDRSCYHNLCCPVSVTESVELIREWMSGSSVLIISL